MQPRFKIVPKSVSLDTFGNKLRIANGLLPRQAAQCTIVGMRFLARISDKFKNC